MIKIQAWDKKTKKMVTVDVTPTVFPDGTSQVWKLEGGGVDADDARIIWHFEKEGELMDVASIRMLLDVRNVSLHMPYLPYARQDKDVDNNSTFNLHVFAKLINSLDFHEVTGVDVHNPELTKHLINNFKNLSVEGIHNDVIDRFRPDRIIFPDAGASGRYEWLKEIRPTIVFEKHRDQSTGAILGFKMTPNEEANILRGESLLIVDDICDGGATFVGVAQAIRKMQPQCKIGLFITHGVFSKGVEVFNGLIDTVYTTNSIIKNESKYEV